MTPQQSNSQQLQHHQSQQQQQVQQITISQLKDSIHLSTNKLLELTYTQQKYLQTIINFNNQAIQHIHNQQQQQALVYLAQAQRTLQYGASCGKSIDRNLIIAVLNNQACCYYREAELTKCASYLQGVIYNLKAFGTSMELSPNNSNLTDNHNHNHNNNHNQKHKPIDEFYHISLQKKIQLVHYSLRYTTINSQMAKRQPALKSGYNVVKLVKSIFYDLTFQNPKIFPLQLPNKQQQQLKDLKQLIKTQIFLKQQIDCEQLDVYRKLARVYVKKWNQRKISNRIRRQFEKHIRDYSISQVIDILPVEYINNSDTIYEGLCNTKVILRQLLHMAMGYFTISTQHRLLAEYRYSNSIQQKHQSDQYHSANIYHLLGIIFLAINLNSDLLFMKQLISSYQQHYKYQLLLDQHVPDEELQSLSQKLLFQPKKQKISPQNQLLLEKITKLKLKEQRKNTKHKPQRKPNNNHQDKIKDHQYKTLNTTKLNISKEILPNNNNRKRSITKHQTKTISSTKLIQKDKDKEKHPTSSISKFKIALNHQNTTLNINSGMNSSKHLQTSKHIQRKRSYSKDSVENNQTRPNAHTNLHTHTTEKISKAQKTVHEYQLETPTKKQATKKRRRISSLSSTKDIGGQNHRQKGGAGNKEKEKKSVQKKSVHHHGNYLQVERVKSPSQKAAVIGSAKKVKVQKNTQKTQKTQKMNTGDNTNKQIEKKKTTVKSQKDKKQKQKKNYKKEYYF